MKLLLRNFAKIKEAEIRFDGLTVIAGNNNTGKSTVGKVLFTLFHSLRDMPRSVMEERKDFVLRFLWEIYMNNKRRAAMSAEAMKKMAKSREVVGAVETESPSVWHEVLMKGIVQDLQLNLSQEEKEDLHKRIEEAWKHSDAEIAKELATRAFAQVFQGQVNSLTKEGAEASVILQVQGEEKSIRFEKNECVEYQDNINLMEDAIYVEDPFLMEECFKGRLRQRTSVQSQALLEYLETNELPNAIDAIEIKKKNDDIFLLFRETIPGDIVHEAYRFVLRSSAQEQALNVENWSTGIKSFAILKRLLENGALHEKGVLILDELEIHLHPQWQLYYAEILVLLQKAFNLTILLTTHSPFFMDAIEIYTHKHGISDKTKYYLSETLDHEVGFRDVSGKIDEFYEKMANPLQILENLRAELRMGR